MFKYLPFLLFLSIFSFGEGTKQLRPTEADDGYINLMDQQNNLGTERTFALYTATPETSLNIRIVDPTNEQIHFGFKTFSNNSLFCRVLAPDGSVFMNEVLLSNVNNNAGVINDYAQAVSGPSILNAAGYTSLSIDPVDAGDYQIQFRDPTHNPGSKNAKRQFELFDITVVDIAANAAIDGRLWSNAWDVTTNSSTNTFNGAAYIYTNDGITTQVQFQDFAAWSFIIQSNETGPRSTGNVLTDRQSIDGGILNPEYKIFLNAPDENSFPPSEVPEIGEVSFDFCEPQAEYCIEITLSNPGWIEYIIDIDGVAGFDHARDVKLIQNTVSGVNCLPWDGKDGEGNDMPAGELFDIIFSYQAGVTHLFIHDAENNPTGFNVQHVSPDVGLGDPLQFYDDSDPDVNGSVELDGCTSDCHTWSGNFGNNKTINTYWVTFFENDTVKDLSFGQAEIEASADILLVEPMSCDGENLVLEPYNLLNEGVNPSYSWWVNGDSISGEFRFAPASLENNDRITLILEPEEKCTLPDTIALSVMVPYTPIVSNDTSICSNDSIFIQSTPTNGFFRWMLDDVVLSEDTLIKIGGDATRTYVAESNYIQPTTNLILNPDFEEGNVKFETEYTFRGPVPVLLGPGFYTMGTRGEDGFAGAFYPIPDHTTGSGLMMIVDGDTQDGSVVYSTEVTVTDGVEYNFSAWMTNVHMTSPNAPFLQFFINDEPLGEFTIDLEPEWTQFNTFWEADVSGTVEIKIVNKNTEGGGNDFALDDLVFGPINKCREEVLVTSIEFLEANIGQIVDQEICDGESITLKVVDTLNLGLAPTYRWFVNGALQTSVVNEASFDGLKDGDSIIVEGTSSIAQCIVAMDRDTIVVRVFDNPEITMLNQEICDGDTAILLANVQNETGVLQYTWSSINAFIEQNDSTIQTFLEGDYQLIVLDENTCTDTLLASTIVYENPVIGLENQTVCEGDSMILAAKLTKGSGVMIYDWTTIVDFIQINDSVIFTKKEGVFQVLVTDINTCKDSIEVNTTVYQNPIVTLTDQEICSGDSVIFDAKISSGVLPVKYIWSSSSTFEQVNDSSIETKVAGIYQVIVEDANECIDTTEAQLLVFDNPEVNLVSQEICDGDTAQLQAIVTGGAGMIQYSWNTVSAFTILNDSLIGTTALGQYLVQVEDENSCSDTVSAQVIVYTNPTINSENQDVCEGSTAAIVANVTDGFGNLQYTWSSTSTFTVIDNQTIETNNDGDFKVLVEDDHSCKDSLIITVIVHANPELNTLLDQEICQGEEALFEASLLVQTKGTQYKWESDSSFINTNDSSITVNKGGTYQVFVEDENACFDSLEVKLVVHDNPILSILDQNVCENDTATLVSSVKKGSGVIQYFWTSIHLFEMNNESIKTVEEGDYKLVIVDDNTCKDSLTAKVILHENPVIALQNQEICENENVYLSVTLISGSANLSYEWSSVAAFKKMTEGTIQTSISGDFTVFVEDENSCKDTAFANVIVHKNPSITIQDQEICKGEVAVLEAKLTVGKPAINYQWNADSVFVQINDSVLEVKNNGVFGLIIQDVNTCKDTAYAKVIVHENPIVTIEGTDVCNGNEAELTAVTDANVIQYTWLPNENISSTSTKTIQALPSTSTNYSVEVIDENSCKGTASELVGVTDFPVSDIVQDDILICEGESVLFNASNIPANYNFTWFYKGTNDAKEKEINTQNFVNASEVGEYFFVVSNGGFCDIRSESVFIQKEIVRVTAQADKLEVYPNETLTLTAQTSENVQSVSWDAPVVNPNLFSFTFLPEETMTYWVEAKGEKCTAEDTITVLVFPTVIIPNGFSPNGDDKNEAWFIKNIDAYPNAEVVIFNRWGSVVYRYQGGYDEPWKGVNLSGQDLPVATYYYTISLNDAKEQSFQGSISIIR